MRLGRKVDALIRQLHEIKKLDANPYKGRLFTYIYETGDEALRDLAHKAFDEFLDTNALDPMVFGSALFFEKEIITFSKNLVHGGDDVVGTVTYGGTESIMLAVRAARGLYRKRKGVHPSPRIIAPLTIHPSVKKAADYLGLRVTLTSIDPETKKADIESVKAELRDDVALVALSAPNYPYGTIDPIRDIAEVAFDKGIPVHVDACIGGFILPFMEKLGSKIEPFDFRVEGVTSLSMDLHKYGYSPKGASVLLFRGVELKKESLYVDLSWPGYPFINTTVLSSRSVAPLAAAWMVINYLGIEGYIEKTKLVIKARDDILKGLERLGFKTVAPVESSLLSLTLPLEDDLFRFHANMTKRGWIIGLQPKIEGLAPYNIHLTITPMHAKIVDAFIKDAEESLKESMPRELEDAKKLLEKDPLILANMIGKTPYDSIIIAWLLSAIPSNIAWEMARELVVEVYRA